jgi:hypothetical protein
MAKHKAKSKHNGTSERVRMITYRQKDLAPKVAVEESSKASGGRAAANRHLHPALTISLPITV